MDKQEEIPKESVRDGFPDLVCKCRSGDQQAFAEIVKRLAPRAYGLAYSLLRNHQDAEDISQDAFVRAFKNLSSFDVSRPFEVWLLTIVANLAKNKLRWKKLRERLVFSLDGHAESNGDESAPIEVADSKKNNDPGEAFGHSLLQTEIWSALASLPAQQNIAIYLKFIEGYKIAEVARMMELSEGTVKTHIFRGLEKLKKLMDGKGYELS